MVFLQLLLMIRSFGRSLSRCLFPRLLPRIFSKVNFNRPVKDLVYKDLLTSTFTQASHDRGIRSWRVSASYPQCVFCGNKFRYEAFNVECHMDPNIGKATIGKERTIAACKESLPTSRGPHRNRFLEVQADIRA